MDGSYASELLALLAGLGNSILVSVIRIALGMALGVALGAVRYARLDPLVIERLSYVGARSSSTPRCSWCSSSSATPLRRSPATRRGRCAVDVAPCRGLGAGGVGPRRPGLRRALTARAQ
jgi:hypothetical protein